MPPTVNFILTHPEALVPRRAHDSDIGYDLTAVEIWKTIGDKITIYDTGVAVQPPPGYYTEILPRSSISKTGYILANSVGVIDPDYTGSLKIAVIRVDESLPVLECPFTRFQLVLRKAEHFDLQQVQSFQATQRGSGGFGSTDVVPKSELWFHRDQQAQL